MANETLSQNDPVCKQESIEDYCKELERFTKFLLKVRDRNRRWISTLPLDIAKKVAEMNETLFMQYTNYSYKIQKENDKLHQQNNKPLHIEEK